MKRLLSEKDIKLSDLGKIHSDHNTDLTVLRENIQEQSQIIVNLNLNISHLEQEITDRDERYV